MIGLSHLNLEKKDEAFVNRKSGTCWEVKLIGAERANKVLREIWLCAEVRSNRDRSSVDQNYYLQFTFI